MQRGTGVAAAVVTVVATGLAAGCSASSPGEVGSMDRVAATSSPGESGSRGPGAGHGREAVGRGEVSPHDSPTPRPGTTSERDDQDQQNQQDQQSGHRQQDKKEPGEREPGKEQPRTLEYGAEGPRVEAVQRTLRHLHYDPGAVDGVYGATTRYALWAFQKVNGLAADGVVGPKTRKALENPEVPEPLEPGGPADRVEIDLDRQLLYVYDKGKLALISHISSGSRDAYCTEDGHCGDAVTPAGEFSAIWRVNGWRKSDLGRLYNPVYFASGGFAVHGSPSVPQYPASHGCVRIPMHTAEKFPDLVAPGEPFYVEG